MSGQPASLQDILCALNELTTEVRRLGRDVSALHFLVEDRFGPTPAPVPRASFAPAHPATFAPVPRVSASSSPKASAELGSCSAPVPRASHSSAPVPRASPSCAPDPTRHFQLACVIRCSRSSGFRPSFSIACLVWVRASLSFACCRRWGWTCPFHRLAPLSRWNRRPLLLACQFRGVSQGDCDLHWGLLSSGACR